MWALSAATRIYLAPGPTDLRKGFEGLYGLMRDRLQVCPQSGHLGLFCNRDRTRLKLLYWDGTGLWICTKRLERGRFSWPSAAATGEGKVVLSQEELALLLGGIELKQTRRKAWYGRQEEKVIKAA